MHICLIVVYDVVSPYADLPQSICHSQFAICAGSPYASSPYDESARADRNAHGRRKAYC